MGLLFGVHSRPYRIFRTDRTSDTVGVVVIDAAGPAQTLESILLEKLVASRLPEDVIDTVLAALVGPEELQAVLDEESKPSRAAAAEGVAITDSASGVYLSSINVEGFRGIGQSATLKLTPGPGLTLVAGRNGSGKSSFAEAVELALTGENKRWASPRPAVWRDGWRNLHHQSRCGIAVELAVDGQAGTTKVVREWADGDKLDAGESFAQPKGKPRRPLNEMGWHRALQLYRPFLSYAELGALVDGRPSEMYDALAKILGLEALAAAESLLGQTRKELDATVKASDAARPELQKMLEGRGEPSAERARRELSSRTPNLAVLSTIVSAGAPGESGTDNLGSILAIALPDTGTTLAAVKRLAQTRAAVAALAGGSAEDARRLSNLLGMALEHQIQHPDAACPVCAGRTLDQGWAEATRSEIDRLRALAASAENAHRESVLALAQVRQLVGPLPPILRVPTDGLDLSPVAEAWTSWLALANGDDVGLILRNAHGVHKKLYGAVVSVQDKARSLMQERTATWQPIVVALNEWLVLAGKADRAKRSLAPVKAAIAWLKSAGTDVRAARLAPFAETSAKVWGQLRQESNVDLGPIRLSGTSTSTMRKVALEVTIDGKPGAALSVMSQGELHALGLALFLPRASAAASPFRFLVIDDPVQSMDPAKVAGLARVLADAARTRQVVVLSHDDRLAEAVRQLQSPATIWEVVRGEGSTVEVTRNDNPIGRYLSDAWAVAKTKELTPEAQALVVVGMCRGALEAACHQRIRSRQMQEGVRHAQIEQAIEEARKLQQVMALALFDDMDRGGQVVPKLSALGGEVAVRAFKVARSGVHEPYPGDLVALVRDIRDLAVKVAG